MTRPPWRADASVLTAATAEVLATMVNTLGPEKLGNRLDPVTRRNIRAAAQQEKNHYGLLTSSAVGGRAVATQYRVRWRDHASTGHAGPITRLVTR